MLENDTLSCRNIGQGIEFVVTYASEPVLYVIKRQLRESARVATQQAFYFVLFGNVYQAPTLHACLTARCARCLHHLDSAFTQLKHDLEPLEWQAKRRSKWIKSAEEEAPVQPSGMQEYAASGEIMSLTGCAFSPSTTASDLLYFLSSPAYTGVSKRTSCVLF